MEFVLDRPIALEESLTCEFKEVKSQPLQAIGKIVDEYVVAFLNSASGSIYWGIRDTDRVVTGVPTSHRMRDELRQVIGQKIASIAPPAPVDSVEIPFHEVHDLKGERVSDVYVIEVRVTKPETPSFFLTGGGEAYRKTLGGIKKLSGSELFVALANPLQSKQKKASVSSLLQQLPQVHARSERVRSLVSGRRVLWVDDHPSNNFYERVALGEMGIIVDVATSTEEGLNALTYLRPDVVVSDMERHGKHDAGIALLHAVRTRGVTTPFIFYVGEVVEARGRPLGAFGITDGPDEVLHLVLDALERRIG